jgi:ribonuclease P protein component
MVTFRKLFSLTKAEIACALKHAQAKKYQHGIKILAVPLTCSAEPVTFGRMLVITPRTSGKAHDRNRIRRFIKTVFYEEKLYQNPALWVVIVYKRAMELEFEDMKKLLKGALE